MNHWRLLGVVLFAATCGTTHPIMQVNPIDVTVTQPAGQLIPEELVVALGWGVLSSATTDFEGEEFRILLTSGTIPNHLFRVKNEGDVKGEGILFWPKNKSAKNTIAPQQNMEEYLGETCSKIMATTNFEYCRPELKSHVNWDAIYHMLVKRNIWVLPDEAELSPQEMEAEMPWGITVQTRYQIYYRSITHSNPMGSNGAQILDVRAIAEHLRDVAASYKPAQNFNVYQGVTSGVRGSEFIPCDVDEVWRFNGSLEQLMTKRGMLTAFEHQDSLLFFVNVQGTLREEWYTQRQNSGFSKVLYPTEINNIKWVPSVNTCTMAQ